MPEYPVWVEMISWDHGRSHCCIWGTLSGWLTGGLVSGGVRQSISDRSAYDIGVPLRAVQVDPPVGFLGIPIGHYFFLVGRQKAAL